MAEHWEPGPNPTPPSAPRETARGRILTGRQWAGVVVLVFLVVAVIIGSLDDSGNTSTAPTATPQTATSAAPDQPVVAPEPEQTTTTMTKPRPKPPATPQYTLAQQNAIDSAQQYLEFSAFSRAGLIEQLSSDAGEGYSKADATFAVDHIEVDWNEQAVRSAQQYLELSPFSRAGLIEQLSSQAGERFTHKQAIYAADHVGLK